MTGRIDRLEIVWHRALRPGYGWIFPCGDGVFNIGVGISEMRATGAGARQARGEPNLRQIYDRFTRLHARGGGRGTGGGRGGGVKGGPLRVGWEGARFSRPGLRVCGEAAGSTYAFTGEGIGKALQTGILAARSVIEGQAGGLSDAQVRAVFEAGLNELKPRFQMYQRANLVNRQPWLADLVVWRAGRSARIRRRLSGLLDETSNPGHLWTARGVFKLFTE